MVLFLVLNAFWGQLLHRRVNPFVQQVQDYRFLCPNTTAFDQELQICANWADVDCDKATSLYDKGDLNDLYRGGDDSKAAHEEEATFHLQRAESGKKSSVVQP